VWAWLWLGEVLGLAKTHRNQLGAAQTGLAQPLSHLAKMQKGEAEKESPGMLPAAVTTVFDPIDERPQTLRR